MRTLAWHVDFAAARNKSFGPAALYRSTFPFTHHRIAFVVYRRATPNRIAPTRNWFESIDDIAMPSPHRRAAEALLSAKRADTATPAAVVKIVIGIPEARVIPKTDLDMIAR